METTMFLCGALVVWDAYLSRRTWVFGIAAGLLLWTRPEGLLFLFVLLLDAAFQAKGVVVERSK
jgi:hypothetical protein